MFHIESINLDNPVKMKQFLVLLLVSTALAFPGGDHHGDGQDDKCVDISQYTEVTFNETVQPICCYQVQRNCQKKSKNVCITAQTTKCHDEAYTVCKSVPTVAVYHDDVTVTETFVPKKCYQNGVHPFEEVKEKAFGDWPTTQPLPPKYLNEVPGILAKYSSFANLEAQNAAKSLESSPCCYNSLSQISEDPSKPEKYTFF